MAYQALSPVHTHTHYFIVAIKNTEYVKESSILNLLKYEGGSKSFLPHQLFKVTEIRQLCYFSI